MDEIYQAPLLKRILSGILDMTVATLLAIGLFMLLINGAVDIGFHNLDYKIRQFKLEEESGLFYVRKDSDGNYLEVSTLRYDETSVEEPINFAKTLYNYYQNFVVKDNKSNTEFNKKYMGFDENNLKNAVFSIYSINDDYTSYTLLDEVTDITTNKKISKENKSEYNTAIMRFYYEENKGVYNIALSDFTNDTRFLEIAGTLQSIERLEALICMAVSSLIFIALPVLINKNGETAFMHVFSLCFSDSYGYKVKWKHKIIRAIVIVVLNSVSVYLYAAPLLVNILLCLFTPTHRSLIDYASNEVAVDKKNSVIIDN